MTAYHGKIELKKLYVDRAAKHREADEIVQSYGYWKNGKGCAIGCLAHADNRAHHALEKDAGLPATLNYLADSIFEGLPNGKYRTWPQRYAEAPQIGADLSLVTARFMAWLLTEEVTKNFDADKFPDVAKSCRDIAAIYQRKIDGEEITDDEWQNAADAADAAARAAYAADAAADAAARAADAAARAAYAADAAADAAARAAYAADAAARAAARAADAAAYERMADKLIELMQNA